MGSIVCAACGKENSDFNPSCAACGAVLPEDSAVLTPQPPGVDPSHAATFLVGDEPTEPATASLIAPPLPTSPREAATVAVAREAAVRATAVEPDPEDAGPALPGQLVAGKYRIERKIAEGGMGVVMAARHEALDQPVAVKFLRPEVMQTPKAVARFLREARAAANIPSDHVGRVHDVGVAENGAPFMVMEYLEGSDLADELDRRGRLPVAEAVTYARETLEALTAAHRLGIVHRDLKPSNLFLCRRADGSCKVKVLDFGISKLAAESDGAVHSGLTTSRTMLGSPSYMSPEQVRSSKSVDARSDLWSLGVILHEALAGTRLFSGDTMGEVFSKIREDEIPRLGAVRPDVPPALEQIVMRCLERKPERRFASAAELRAALSPFAAGVTEGVAPSPEAAPVSPVSTLSRAPSSREAVSAQTGAAWAGAASPSVRRTRAGIVLAVLSIGGAAAYVLSHAHGAPVGAAQAPIAVAPPVVASVRAKAAEIGAASAAAPAAPETATPAATAVASASAASVVPPGPRSAAPKAPSASTVDVLRSRY